MRKTIHVCLWAIAFGLVGFACTLSAMAAPPGAVPDPAIAPGDFIEAGYAAATSKRWSVVAGLALIGLAFLVRKYVLGRVAWFQSRLGGFVLAFGLSLAGTFGLALASAAPMSWLLALDALGTAATAAGGWAWLQNAMEKKPAAGSV